MNQKTIQKRFPADVTLDKEVQTFLRDKKIDAELYALLQQYSMPVDIDDGHLTVVVKVNLPKQDEMLKTLGMKSKTTFRNHLKYLVESEYVIDDAVNKRYILPDKENIFFYLPLETV